MNAVKEKLKESQKEAEELKEKNSALEKKITEINSNNRNGDFNIQKVKKETISSSF